MPGRVFRGHPPKRVLALCLVIALVSTIALLSFNSIPLSELYKEKALDRICGPSVDRYSDQDSSASKDWLSGSHRKPSIDSAGSKNTLGDGSEHAPHSDADDLGPLREYEKSAKMTATPDIIQGNATLHFRDNLRPHQKYVTGWNDGGFTNQFMGTTHLILISLLTPHHVPILPPFSSRPHLPVQAGFRPVSHAFDVERWARSINKEMVEWKDVKDLSASAGRKADDGSIQADGRDKLGCWSIWATSDLNNGRPRGGHYFVDHLNLDTSYTPIPRQARLFQNNNGDFHTNFNALAALAHATESNPNPLSSDQLAQTFASTMTGHTLKPDTQVTCYDYLYWIASTHPFEWEQQYSNAWNLVGKYARWSDKIRSLVRESISLTLSVSKQDVMHPVHGDPDWRDDRDGHKYHENDLKALDERDKIRVPYISMHARHGDFKQHCGQSEKPCYPSLSTFINSVEEIEKELRAKGIVEPGWPRLPVIMTSDEKDPEWWKEVTQLGWKRVVFPSSLSIPDGVHGMEKNLDAETYERIWNRMLVEMAVQGYGTGFVGTELSTMSLVAQRRVEHWQKGVARTVKFFT